MHFASDPDDGLGRRAPERPRGRLRTTTRRGGTLYPDGNSYLKTGLYRSSDIDDDGTVYYDDVVIASNRDAASSLASAS